MSKRKGIVGGSEAVSNYDIADSEEQGVYASSRRAVGGVFRGPPVLLPPCNTSSEKTHSMPLPMLFASAKCLSEALMPSGGVNQGMHPCLTLSLL